MQSALFFKEERLKIPGQLKTGLTVLSFLEKKKRNRHGHVHRGYSDRARQMPELLTDPAQLWGFSPLNYNGARNTGKRYIFTGCNNQSSQPASAELHCICNGIGGGRLAEVYETYYLL